MSDYPPLDLSILHRQLSDLFEKAVDATNAHNGFLRVNGVPNKYSSSWYQEIFTESESLGMKTENGWISWCGRDADGDIQWMEVPISVLDGSESVEEWAARTYTRYLERERGRAADALIKWNAAKEQRREQFEKLKAEFEDAEANGNAAG